MSFKPIVHWIDPSLKRSTGPSCRGDASSQLRVSRTRSAPGSQTLRRPSWLQRAVSYLRRPPAPIDPAFSVSEYGVGSTG